MARRKKNPSIFKQTFKWQSWLILSLLLASLVFLLSRFEQVQIWFTEAVGRNARIVIPLHHSDRTPLRPIWQGISQGLEGDETMLTTAVSAGRELNLQLVRIDHIYDQFVDITDIETLQVDFSKLDQLVLSIVEMGATPVFALSYMPPQLSADGTVEGPPSNWSHWQQLVRQTIIRYSGTNNYNINNIYYEVWNEPDLFGEWKPDRDPRNYLTLYQQSARAAENLEQVNNFYLGGPATTGMYPNWIKALVNHTREQNLRLDFISWHRYGQNLGQYSDDAVWINNWLADQGRDDLQLIISEWGFNSDLDQAHDSAVSAAHAVAVISQLTDQVDWLLPFEMIDGLDPSGRRFWGRWGMLTHPSQGLVKKPRYHAFTMLNQLQGERGLVVGEGSWVKALASISPDRTRVAVILANYDLRNHHQEAVPVDILGLQPGQYQVTTSYLDGRTQTIQIPQLAAGAFRQIINMEPNEVALLEINRLSL